MGSEGDRIVGAQRVASEQRTGTLMGWDECITTPCNCCSYGAFAPCIRGLRQSLRSRTIGGRKWGLTVSDQRAKFPAHDGNPTVERGGDMKPLQSLSRREREIMDIVFGTGSATASEVRDRMPDPPSYSAVRA